VREGIFLDDERHPNQVYWVNLPKDVNWTIVRSYDEFVETVANWYKTHGKILPDIISFDHDLSFEHYMDVVNSEEKTGLDAAKWLVQFAEEHAVSTREFPYHCVHSMNVVGAQRIHYCIVDFLDAQIDRESKS
jgi:hypothetical protein